jgi:hypothetical protein
MTDYTEQCFKKERFPDLKHQIEARTTRFPIKYEGLSHKVRAQNQLRILIDLLELVIKMQSSIWRETNFSQEGK